MTPNFFKSATSVAAFLGLSVAAFAQTKVTYTDNIQPIFRNACTNCHNPDKKKAGLDLTTYQAAIAGSENGPVIKPGNPDGSLMFKVCKADGDPKMPPKGDSLTDADMALLKNWIAGFALENANSKPATVAANKVDVAVVSLKKPDGPPPMPGDLPLEPFVKSRASNAVIAMAASPWSPLVAIGGQKQVFLYNTETLERLGVLAFPEGFPNVLRFSRNAKLLLAGGGLGGKIGKVVMWDVTTGERIGVVGNEADAVLAADISPDQQFIALGGPNKQVKIYSTKDGRQTGLIKKHTEWVTAIAYSPDGKFLATADRNGGVEVWESGADPKPFNTLAGHKVACTALAFMPGVLASASEDGKISLWNVKEGTEIRSWAAHPGGVLWVDFTPDGRIVSCGRDKIAKVWDSTGKQLLATEAFGDLALRCALNSERVIAADWTGDIRVFAIDGKKLGSLSANPAGIAEQLALAKKTLTETQAALPNLQKAVTNAEVRVKAEREAAEAKRKTDLSAAEQRKAAAVQAVEAAKAAPGNAQKAADDLKAQLAKAQEALGTARKGAAEIEAAATSRLLSSAEAGVASAQGALDHLRLKATAARRAADTAKFAADTANFEKADTQAKGFEPELARAEKSLADAKRALASAQAVAAPEKAAAAKAAVASAQKTIEETRQRLQKAQGEFARAQSAAPKAIAAAQKAVEAVDADIAKLQPGKYVSPPEVQAKVAALQKTFGATTAQVEPLRAARAKFKDGTPEYAKASAAVQAKKDEATKIEAELNAAKAALTTPQPTDAEKAVASAKAALDAANAQLAASQTGIARWKRAQLYQTVFNAKQTVAEKQAHHDDLIATAKDAFRQVEMAKQGIVNDEKTVADGPKTVAEKEAAFQKVKQDADAAATELAKAEKAVADARAKPPEGKVAEEIKAVAAEIDAAQKKFDTLEARRQKLREEREKFQRGTPEYDKANAPYQAARLEMEKAQTALNAAKAKQTAKPGESPVPEELTEAVKKAELDARLASRKVPAAEKAIATAKKEIEDAKKQAVELKGRIAQMEKDAAKTKADAEHALTASAKELEAAKAEAEKLRAQYEAAKKAGITAAAKLSKN
jgi:WD40 repeat protein/chromosome segregation ATPase